MKLVISIAVLALLAACSSKSSDDDSDSTMRRLPAPPTSVAFADMAHSPSEKSVQAR